MDLPCIERTRGQFSVYTNFGPSNAIGCLHKRNSISQSVDWTRRPAHLSSAMSESLRNADSESNSTANIWRDGGFQSLLLFESPARAGTCPVNSLKKLCRRNMIRFTFGLSLATDTPPGILPASYVSSILHYGRSWNIISETCSIGNERCFFHELSIAATRRVARLRASKRLETFFTHVTERK